LLGADLLGVTRTPEGYDLALLEHLLQTHRPKVFFTQPRLHCPTGASATLAHMYRVLQLAEKYDVTLVENDIYSDLDPRPPPLWPAWTSSSAWSISAAFPKPSHPTCAWAIWRATQS
ncbi:MAG TPA: hypothetical protein PLM12_11515, partial [Comamonas denitrificans]|nr:hypothetical protein [Comamonas denitrificans]